MTFNDQVAGRLGRLIGAPIPRVTLVDVPQDVIDQNPQEMAHIAAGLGHGSQHMPDCTPKAGLNLHLDEGDNRRRHAAIAMFYGWMEAHDQQLIYEIGRPRLAYSVDHGHFFPHGPNWTIDLLNAAAPAQVDQKIMQAGITGADLATPCGALGRVTAEDVAQAVGIPPVDWGVNQDERVALAT